jgi:hypothetical protein
VGQAVLLLVAGLVALAFGVSLARRGYAAIHKRPYAASNGRLLLGAFFMGAGLALVIFGVVMLLAISAQRLRGAD